jgi:hypothetical protein
MIGPGNQSFFDAMSAYGELNELNSENLDSVGKTFTAAAVQLLPKGGDFGGVIDAYHNAYMQTFLVPKHVIDVSLALREGLITRDDVYHYSPLLDGLLYHPNNPDREPGTSSQ